MAEYNDSPRRNQHPAPPKCLLLGLALSSKALAAVLSSKPLPGVEKYLLDLVLSNKALEVGLSSNHLHPILSKIRHRLRPTKRLLLVVEDYHLALILRNKPLLLVLDLSSKALEVDLSNKRLRSSRNQRRRKVSPRPIRPLLAVAECPLLVQVH